MHKYFQSLAKRVVLHRIAPLASLAVAGMVITVAMASGAAPGNGEGLGVFASLTQSRSWAGNEVFAANPNPIKVCGGATTGNTNLTWTINEGTTFEIRRNTANGQIMNAGTRSGEMQLNGVLENSRYYLIGITMRTASQWRIANGRATKVSIQTPTRTVLGSVTIHFTQEGCNVNPPPPANNPPPPVQNPPPPANNPPPPANNPPPPTNTLTCTPSIQNVTVGQPVTVTTNAQGTVDYAFTWSAIGASSVVKNGNSLVVTYTTAGTKTVTVNNYVTTADCTVVVVSAPANNLACSPSVATAPVGQVVTFTATGGVWDGRGYIWSNTADGVGVSGVNSTWRVGYSSPGTKTVTVSMSGAQAQCTVVITEVAPPAQENRVPMVSIDTANCDQNVISGWAVDLDVISNPVTVRLMEGTAVLVSKATDIQRDDVNNYLASTYNSGRPVSGAHGFSFDLTSIRANGAVHLFSLELVDNIGGNVKVNMGSSANLYCPAVVTGQGNIALTYVQPVVIDKFDNSIVVTNFEGRDDTTLTYKEDTITIGNTLDVCPGPDGRPGRRKDITISAWASPNGGSVWVKDSITNQEKWVATLVGPTVQKATWTATLGAGQAPVTYTFRVSNSYSGATTVTSKAIVVRPITGPCDPGEYSMRLTTDGVTYCPRLNQYTRVFLYAIADNVSTQPALGPNDGVILKFRPYGKADIPANYQTIPLENKQHYTNDPHLFAFETKAYAMSQKGTYDFFFKFRGKTIHTVSKEEFVGLPGAFCE